MKILKGNKHNATVRYVQHGIPAETFKKVDVPDEFRNQLFQGKEFKFVLFWMNRNIKRKQPSDVIWAYSKFVDSLPEKDRKSVALIMHTVAIDKNGTDLLAVKEAICPDYHIVFSTQRVKPFELNWLYNIADVTINIAGNEGFGLTTAESLMAQTPIIVNVTGGLQDQCGFQKLTAASNPPLKETWEYFTADDYIEIGSLHEWRKWEEVLKFGEWVKPVWPRVQTMVGSVPTPYIIDDKVDVDEVAVAIKYWYDKTPFQREQAGRVGREWMISDGRLSSTHMCYEMGNAIEDTITNFKPRERYKLYQIR